MLARKGARDPPSNSSEQQPTKKNKKKKQKRPQPKNDGEEDEERVATPKVADMSDLHSCLHSPIPIAWLQEEGGDRGDGGASEAVAEPIALSPAVIAAREATRDALQLTEAVGCVGTAKLAALLGQSLVRESIRRRFNGGLGWGVDGINNWIVQRQMQDLKQQQQQRQKGKAPDSSGKEGPKASSPKASWPKTSSPKAGASSAADLSFEEVLRFAREGGGAARRTSGGRRST